MCVGAHAVQKRALDPLELELPDEGAGNQLRSLLKAPCTLKS